MMIALLVPTSKDLLHPQGSISLFDKVVLALIFKSYTMSIILPLILLQNQSFFKVWALLTTSFLVPNVVLTTSRHLINSYWINELKRSRCSLFIFFNTSTQGVLERPEISAKGTVIYNLEVLIFPVNRSVTLWYFHCQIFFSSHFTCWCCWVFDSLFCFPHAWKMLSLYPFPLDFV